MAVTINQNAGVIQMTAAGDEVRLPLWVKSVRFVAEVGQLAADVIQLSDPLATSEILWETFGMAATATEAELIEKMWHNGVRVQTMTADRGRIYISYK
jgi:hypothetical protein